MNNKEFSQVLIIFVNLLKTSSTLKNALLKLNWDLYLRIL